MLDLNRICSRLKLDPLARGLQIIDAAELAREFFPRLDTDRPALALNLASASSARAVQRTLRVNYASAHPLTVIARNTTREIKLGALAREKKWSAAVALYIPPRAEPSSPQSVAAIVARLRAPRGCPWDREQTHASLRRALLEETYEVLEAIDENDPAKLQEELGDLLLHVLFQTQIARDQNEFMLADVCAEHAAKLIRRHPHVFGAVKVHGAADVIANWERIKREEKKGKHVHAEPSSDVHTWDAGIPRALPALARAQKIYGRAKKQGRGLLPKGSAPLTKGIRRAKNHQRALGDTLLALAAFAEDNQIDATSALREATARFMNK